MDDRDYVVYLRDDREMDWAQVATKLDMHPEAARSFYRRVKGTHERKPTFTHSSEKIDAGEMLRIAFPTDIHAPFHDRYAVALAVNIIKEFNPDILVCGSDAIDFYTVSSFDKDPSRRLRLQSEINAWKEIQKELTSASPNADRIFISGNHEDRLRRYLWRHPELESLDVLKINTLLDFDSVGVKSYRDEVVVGSLVIKHGQYVRKDSAYSAKAEIEGERFSINTMTGHTHRGGTFYAKTRSGIIRADECFCLCSLEADYVKNPNWQHGIVVATVINGQPIIEPILFHGSGDDIFAYWRGKCYTI